MNYKFDLECTDGGWGWGETGQKGVLIVSARSYEAAIEEARTIIPGGWTWYAVGKTDEKPYLRTNIGV
jgi:hypothetical protein